MSEFDQQWWEETFVERQRAIEEVYGLGHPPGSPQRFVTAFTWDDVRIPGGCCIVCRHGAGRDNWAYISLGLTQPVDRAHAKALREQPTSETGYGSEFGLLLREPAEWAVRVVRQLMWYVRRHRPINAGDRMPFGAERDPEIQIDANIGDQASEGRSLVGAMRALIFWPHLQGPSTFGTSVGSFQLLIGTTISQAEWDFAKAHSTEHLMLLLYRCGVGQASDLWREDVVSSHRWGEDVRLVASMSRERATEELRSYNLNTGWKKRNG